MSLAARRNKFGNTTKFYWTRSGFHVQIYNDNKITGPVPFWRDKATIAFLNLKVLLSTTALLEKFLTNMLKLLIIFHQENNRMLVMPKAHF